MRTRFSGSAYGSGRRSAALTALKIAAVAPRPRPTVTMIVKREDGGTQQAANTDAKVLHEILEQQRALHLVLPFFILPPAILPRPVEIAELAQRLAPRVVWRHARGRELVDAHLEMHAQLLVDLRFHGTAAQIPERLSFPAPGSRLPVPV